MRGIRRELPAVPLALNADDGRKHTRLPRGRNRRHALPLSPRLPASLIATLILDPSRMGASLGARLIISVLPTRGFLIASTGFPSERGPRVAA